VRTLGALTEAYVRPQHTVAVRVDRDIIYIVLAVRKFRSPVAQTRLPYFIFVLHHFAALGGGGVMGWLRSVGSIKL